MSNGLCFGQAAGVQLPELCVDTDSTALGTWYHFGKGAVGDVSSDIPDIEDMTDPEVSYS